MRNRTTPRALLAAFPLALLAGCMSDSASYLIDGDNKHTITVLRNQDYFWKKTVDVSIVPTRLPECQESMKVRNVPRDTEMRLYWSPEEYAEPIYILDIAGDFYALGTRACKTQRFDAKPADPGAPLGVFKETAGRLVFEAAAAKPATP